jgi:hypothetical protein
MHVAAAPRAGTSRRRRRSQHRRGRRGHAPGRATYPSVRDPRNLRPRLPIAPVERTPPQLPVLPRTKQATPAPPLITHWRRYGHAASRNPAGPVVRPRPRAVCPPFRTAKTKENQENEARALAGQKESGSIGPARRGAEAPNPYASEIRPPARTASVLRMLSNNETRKKRRHERPRHVKTEDASPTPLPYAPTK